jgi:type IV secretory pathway VirB2 component (pilin)
MKLLVGKKTYLVAIAMVVYAGLGFILGYQNQDQTLKLVFEALGLAALRAGVSSVVPEPTDRIKGK